MRETCEGREEKKSVTLTKTPLPQGFLAGRDAGPAIPAALGLKTSQNPS